MNTKYNSQSRIKSVAGYKYQQAEREAEEARLKQEQAQKDFYERERIERESQDEIVKICNAVQANYNDLIKDGRDMQDCQRELREKNKQEELFYKSINDNYPQVALDETNEREMRRNEIVYYMLPVVDALCASLSLMPVLTFELARSSSFMSSVAEPLGAIAAFVLGYFVSTGGRTVLSSLDENKDKPAGRVVKYIVIALSVVMIPTLYIAMSLAFNGGENMIFAGTFAFLSLVIQLIIVFCYKKQMEALDYMKKKRNNDKSKAAMEADENKIARGKAEVKDKVKVVMDNFRHHYDSFDINFRHLAVVFREHVQSFAVPPRLFLNQVTTYVGNLLCFRSPVIPFIVDDDGNIKVMYTLDFPGMEGTDRLHVTNELSLLNDMLNRNESIITLDNTIGYQEGNDVGQLQGIERTLSSAQTVNDPVNNAPDDTKDVTPEAGTSDPVDDEGTDDNGQNGIW